MTNENPYGVNITKRNVVRTAEAKLFERMGDEKHYVRMFDYMGGDAMVERVATAGHGRNIFPQKPSNAEFLSELVSRGIDKPFYFTQMRFQVGMTIGDGLDLIYDPTFSVNVYSGRYSELDDSCRLPPIGFLEKRMKALGAKGDPKLAYEILQKAYRAGRDAYDQLRGQNVNLARELARSPLGMTTDTMMVLKADLPSLVGFIDRKRRQRKIKPDIIHSYLDAFEAAALSVAPNAYLALMSNLQRRTPSKIDFTMPTDDAIVDSAPMPVGWEPKETKRVVVPALEELLFVPQAYLSNQFKVQAVDYLGADREPAQSARVSYGSGTTKISGDRKLTNRLVGDKHTSPFEQVVLAVDGTAPSFTDPWQMGRHRTLKHHGFMGEFPHGSNGYIPADDQIRAQDDKNKQGRAEELSTEAKQHVKDIFLEAYLGQAVAVDALRELGLDESIARDVKGHGFTTSVHRIGDIHNIGHMLGLRLDHHAQFEIQEQAKIYEQFMDALAPMTMNALREYKIGAQSYPQSALPLLAALAAHAGISSDDINLFKAMGQTAVLKKSGERIVKKDGLRVQEHLQGLENLAQGEATQSILNFLKE